MANKKDKPKRKPLSKGYRKYVRRLKQEARKNGTIYRGNVRNN